VPGQNKSFRPKAPELVEQVRLFANAIRFREGAKDERAQIVSYPIGSAPPPPMVALGPISVDFGAGKIDMRDMRPSEKEAVHANRGMVQVEGPIEGAKLVLPRLRGME
jgi:hypothetical protein